MRKILQQTSRRCPGSSGGGWLRGRHGRAAIIHDWLYQRGTIVYPNERPEDERPSRIKSDRIFREAMEVLDNVVFTRHKFWGRSRLLMNLRLAVALPRRWLVWLAVRLSGAGAYRP